MPQLYKTQLPIFNSLFYNNYYNPEIEMKIVSVHDIKGRILSLDIKYKLLYKI